MFKLIALLLTLSLTQAVYAQSVSSYFNQIKSLSDTQLLDYMQKKRTFGQCSFYSSLSGGGSCKYSIYVPNKGRTCFSSLAISQGLSAVIGLARPASLSAAVTTRAHFNTVRSSLVNFATADSKAANFIRQNILTANNCNFNSSNLPGSGENSITSMNDSNISFFVNSHRPGQLYCKTQVFSASYFDHSSCSRVQKEKTLPSSLCKIIYNRMKKLNNTNVANITPQLMTAAQAAVFVNMELSAQLGSSVTSASSAVPLENAIPVRQLAQAEFLDSYATCSPATGCDSVMLTQLAATVKSNSTNNSYEVDSTMKTFANSIPSSPAQAVSLNTAVLSDYNINAQRIDARATRLSANYGGLATIASIATRAAPCALTFQVAPASVAPSL